MCVYFFSSALYSCVHAFLFYRVSFLSLDDFFCCVKAKKLQYFPYKTDMKFAQLNAQTPQIVTARTVDDEKKISNKQTKMF